MRSTRSWSSRTPSPTTRSRSKIRALIAALREVPYDPREVEEDRWIGDDTIRELGERGLLGLYVPEEYGGQGLSQTGYCRVSEAFAQIDPTLSVIMGVHQSIGMKGIVLFGNDEQKARFLPDLASGRKLAAFALTEPEAGSDVHGMQTRAEREADGSWRLDGMKHYIGNGSQGRRARDVRHHRRGPAHGVHRREGTWRASRSASASTRWGCAATTCASCTSTACACLAENVLGEPGEGFKIAMHVLNNGRLTLGTGSVGGAKVMLDLAIEHVPEPTPVRPAAGRLRAGPGQDRLDGLVPVRARVHGLPHHRPRGRGVPDYSLESAICKVSGTEFLWYQANRALQLAGGAGYMRDQPYEKILRDIRIFPIFEGANDVMRAFIALAGMKPLGDELKELRQAGPRRPDRLDRRAGRLRGRAHPARGAAGPHHAGPRRAARPRRRGRRPGQAAALGDRGAAARAQGASIMERQFHQKRLADAVSDIYGAGRGAVARHGELRGARRGAVGPGALHRRDLLPPRRRAGDAQPRPDRVERRRAHGGDREARLQARGVRLRVLRGLSADRRPKRLVLVAAILGTTVVTVDWTVVNVALPAIQEDLGGGLAGQQWTSNAYLVTLGSLLLIGGSLGDIFGERRVFALGVAGFGATSLLCALAPTIEVLVAGAALQGVAGACSPRPRWR